MPNREEMQSLAQHIIGSYEDRRKGIAQLQEDVGALKQDVSTMLEGFGRELKEVHTARATASKQLKADLAKSAADLKQEMDTMLQAFDQAHAAMSQEMKADLDKGVADRKQDVVTRLKGFDQELERVHAARATASKELRADLAKSAAHLKQDVGTMLQGFDQELKEVHDARAAASKELRADLAKSTADLKQDVDTRLKEFDAALAEVRATLAGGRDEWQKLTATMQSKRGGVAVAVKPLIEEIAEGAAEITPETAALREQVFEYLANHPDGTRLVELAEEFGIARIQIAKVVRRLIGENKVEKRDLLYFAV